MWHSKSDDVFILYLNKSNQFTFFFHRQTCGSLSITDKFGATQIKFPGYPFCLQVNKDVSTLGKVFATKTFEQMYALGYDFVCSTDLARLYDHSTWFFAKSQQTERPKKKFLCVAPGSFDKLVVVQGAEHLISALRDSISQSWRYGIQKEEPKRTSYGPIYEFKLNGNPWVQTGEEAAMCRRMLLTIIGRMGQLHWKLVASTNLKGGTDTMMFVYEENYSTSLRDLSMVSLNRQDRIRLINFDESNIPIVRQSIMRRYQQDPPSEKMYHRAYEFKLNGYPFFCSGEEAVASRRLICQILADLSSSGWDCFNTMDVTRRLSDKSVLIMQRSQPLVGARFACVALTDVDHLRLIDFPSHVTQALRNCVTSNYFPGVVKEKQTDSHCLKMYLAGQPWLHITVFTLHARTCLMKLLEEAAKYGWYLKASADVSAKCVRQKNGPDYPLDVHSWFFCHYGNM